MSDVYLIKKETLTNIRDAIWDNSSDVWVGEFMTPEQMSDAIYDVYDEGYNYGHEDGYIDGVRDSHIKDLARTQWRVHSGWYAYSNGVFEIGGEIHNVTTGGVSDGVYRIHIGYEGVGKPKVDKIYVQSGYGNFVISSKDEVIFKITGGADSSNTDLINWFYDYGALESTYEIVFDEAYDKGYNYGYDEGLYNGISDGLNYSLNSGTVPLMIQGLMRDQADEDDIFPPSVYTQDLCGTSYSLSSFIKEEVVASSTKFTMSVINNTDCAVDLYCRAVCNTDIDSEQEEFVLYVAAQSDSSHETTLGMGTQHQEWTYEILGVYFYYEYY